MRITKKVLSLILTMVMVLGLLPATAFAAEAEQVYISISYDGQFTSDKNGAPVAYVPVSMDDLAAIDLNAYNLGNYLYDGNGDGIYDITALHLYIYAHEQIMGGSWDDVTVSGSPGSIYFESGLFGFTENLQYYHNGVYPQVDGWGVTADQLTLADGDFMDLASYSSWSFYSDSAYGFHYFADSEGSVTHDYSTQSGSDLQIKLVRATKDASYQPILLEEAGYEVYIGASLGNVEGTFYTDNSGCATIPFSSAGTWYLWCNGGYGMEDPGSIVSSPAYAKVTVAAQESGDDDTPHDPQDVSTVLDATMAKLAATVTEPVFGTTAGEWTVLSLARGGYYAKDNAYFTDYYARIVETVNTKAASVNLNGALHASKSTDNSRLIVALSSIGKNATSVGDWNLVTPYDDFDWIINQGLNGPIWALIALDSNDYQTTNATIRQQCVDYILSKQLDDGGWALSGTTANSDITGMALQALYPYKNQSAVAAAAEEAFTCLSNIQQENGTYTSSGDETAESCAQVIVACATWGINPDTDSRFIKNDKSVVDALLTYYVADSAEFKHVAGGTVNAMATDQACYALVAYDRLLNNQPALYDMSDVTFDAATPDSDEMTATLGLPAEINAGDTFNGVISINKWDNEAGYKLIDFIMTIPEGVSVTGVTASDRLSGGEVSYNLEAETGKLRVVYFDANENSDISISGTEFPAELFTVNFKADSVTSGSTLDIAITGMSVKLTSESSDKEAMIVVNTDTANGSVSVVVGISFSAVCLYEGDDVDLIPSTKKAVAVAVTGIANGSKLTYNDGTNEIEFKYSAEITAKTGVASYVALVDAAIEMENFVNESYFTIANGESAAITFGDSNGDGVINAQDALAAVDTWLRKGEEPTDDAILTLNVNGDSRINTFDALGIVEKFVNGSDYGVVTKAATITTNQ